MFDNSSIGETFEINEILTGNPCLNCSSCLRMRLMEMGLTEKEKIRLEGYSHGLWRLGILSENGKVMSVLALREEEVERICVL